MIYLIFVVMRDINEVLNKHRIILYRCDIDDDIASSEGESVVVDGDLTSYYLEDGFDCYNAYTNVSRGNYRLAHRVAIIVGFLNPEKRTEDLFEYMDILCETKYDNENFKINRPHILNVLKNSQEGLYDVTPEIKKYYWVGEYKYANRSKKSSIILNHSNNNRVKRTFNAVERAVALLIEEGNESNTFITIKDIVEVSGLSKPTVHKAIGLFKEDINNYNTVKFQTSNYTEFVKLSNIGSIVGVIEKFIEEMEMKVTQRKVASRSRLHYNTVNNLWFEEEVQDVLDRYNKQKREFKKNKGCTT